MHASVIMPTYNKARFLARTLASYEAQTSSSYEIVVVDDGSSDDTPAVIARYAERLPIRSASHPNRGRAFTRNRALELARAPIVIFSDDDRLVGPGFVERHVAAHAEAAGPCFVIGPAHGLIAELHAGMGRGAEVARAMARWPAIRLSEDDVRRDFAGSVVAHAVVEPTWEAISREPLAVYGPDLGALAIAWFLVYTGNLSIPREHLDRVGGFDEAFRAWSFEDTELGYRLARGGLSGRVALGCENYHQWHRRDWSAAGVRHNAGYFRAKHQAFEVELFIEWLSCLWGEGTPMDFATMDRLVHLARRDREADAALRTTLLHGRVDAVDRLLRTVEPLVADPVLEP